MASQHTDKPNAPNAAKTAKTELSSSEPSSSPSLSPAETTTNGNSPGKTSNSGRILIDTSDFEDFHCKEVTRLTVRKTIDALRDWAHKDGDRVYSSCNEFTYGLEEITRKSSKKP